MGEIRKIKIIKNHKIELQKKKHTKSKANAKENTSCSRK